VFLVLVRTGREIMGRSKVFLYCWLTTLLLSGLVDGFSHVDEFASSPVQGNAREGSKTPEYAPAAVYSAALESTAEYVYLER
jgi:hypothetical protein